MKYRAVAVGVTRDGHPVQSFAQDLINIEAWAKITAAAEHCTVDIWRIREEFVESVSADNGTVTRDA
jgi:hypothetical protein